ncbi:MAG: NACHT domain-containing protein [Anaerolineae bacterium]|nr:NACHT domain-containing protein [Anaerolineae bacterium]
MDTQSDYRAIETIRRITCRIETANDKGTAVFISVDQDGPLYLLTAKHCLLGKNFDQEVEKSKTKIFVPSGVEGQFDEFPLTDDDKILFPEDETLDFAVIVFSRRENLCGIPSVALLDIQYTSHDCYFWGYPQSYESKRMIPIDVNYISHNLLRTSVPLFTLYNDPNFNCRGFSGSGVFLRPIPNSDSVFLSGVIYELEEPFQQFGVCDFSSLNGLLSSHSLPPVSFDTLPTDEEIINDIRKLAQGTDLVLKGIYDRLGEHFFLDRLGIREDFNRKFLNNRLIIVKGIAGVGKSVFAKASIQRLQQEHYYVFAFKADSFVRESLGAAFDYIDSDFKSILEYIGQTQQVVVLIDSLEKLLETMAYEALKEFLRICKELQNVKIIITCRNHAYQQLVFQLHYEFPKYDSVEVSLFTDAEFEQVESQFPLLVTLTQNERVKQILRRPFYLQLVIKYSQLAKRTDEFTERDFKKLIWDEVISKRNIQRGRIFETIALQRAVSMNLYARVDGLDPVIVKQLFNDNIILIEEQLAEAYTPSHDVYEDIALTRFVERVYQEKQTTLDFFHRFGGKKPAKRRAFRLWVNDSLFDITPGLRSFIYDVFESDEVEQYWKDEIIIAILRSEYCHSFFDSSEEILQRDNYSLFVRFIHLLKTTCQEPDKRAVELLRSENKDSLYQGVYLVPAGPGWEPVIDFTYKHFTYLGTYYSLILRLIAHEWAKKLYFGNELPPEAKNAGKILLNIIEESKDQYDSRRNKPYSEKDIDKALEVLFNLCSLFKKEVKKLIEDARNFDAKGSENYRLRDFYSTVIAYTLSGLHSREVCKALPDLVCAVALDKWLLKPKMESVSSSWPPEPYLSSDPINPDSSFGLATGIADGYFPPGIYKTPVRFLLYLHPAAALRFIASVLNHATNAYAESERGKCTGVSEVKILHKDGAITTQIGNRALWAIYRGTIEATSYMLESVLMSLENWLLELCRLKEKWASDLLKIAYDYLLKHSNSVATTAVLASVAMAYPQKIGELCLPLLRVKEFFFWDFDRYRAEAMSSSPLDRRIPFASGERYASNQLPHRKWHLEMLVTKLQIEGYWDEIVEILDGFQDEITDDDTSWRLALNRMDFRKYEIDESVKLPNENQVAVRPKVDADLRNVVEEGQKNLDLMNAAASITNWARKVFDKEQDVEKSVQKWSEEYQRYFDIRGVNEEIVGQWGNPTHLAAVGIRDFSNDLTKVQLAWCVGVVSEVIEQRIIDNIRSASWSPSTMFIKSAVQALPLMLDLNIPDEIRREVKELIFMALLHLVMHEMEYPFESIRNSLWEIDRDFADSCLAGMIEFAKIHKIRRRLSFPPSGEKYEGIWEESFQEEMELASLVCQNQLEFDITSLSFETHSHWFLGFAIQIIPYNTTNELYKTFIYQMFALLFQIFDETTEPTRRDTSDFIQTHLDYKYYLARFLLNQPPEEAQVFFKTILDHVFFIKSKSIRHEGIEFVSGILERIIIEEDTVHSENFWPLWEVLESEIRQTGKSLFISHLFLSSRWWISEAKDWPPLVNRELYLKKIITELGHTDIKSVTKLLAGIGAERLLPDGVVWLKHALTNVPDPLNALNDSDTFLYCEKLVRRAYYKNLRDIKADTVLRESLLYLLDALVNLGSSIAFIIRERVIAV